MGVALENSSAERNLVGHTAATSQAPPQIPQPPLTNGFVSTHQRAPMLLELLVCIILKALQAPQLPLSIGNHIHARRIVLCNGVQSAYHFHELLSFFTATLSVSLFLKGKLSLKAPALLLQIFKSAMGVC